jgi:hypothetical protein
VPAPRLSGVRTNDGERDRRMREPPGELDPFAAAPHALFFEHPNPKIVPVRLKRLRMIIMTIHPRRFARQCR